MNGRLAISRKFHAPAWAVCSLAAALGGCADLHRALNLPPVNPESPVAAQVRAAAPLTYETPRLVDVPPTPKDVPVAADVKLGVIAMVRCRSSVTRYAVQHPPLSAGAEQFASNARDVAKVNPADIPPPDSSLKSEAAAADLRAYAAPPGAFPSGPAPTANEGKPIDLQTPQPAPPRPAGRGGAAAPPAAAPAAPPAAAPSPTPAPAPAVTTAGSAPPVPAPLPDPYLSRCS